MDTKFQTSFIPKRPILASSGGTGGVKRPMNLLSLVGSFIFLLSILALGGVFAYKQYLSGKISAMDQQLSAAQASIQDDLINQFIRLDTRLKSAQQLLQGHVATSHLFETLQNQTVKNVQFADMAFQTDQSGNVTISMKGLAASYNAIAFQATLFDQNKYITNATFSDMSLDDKGNVGFTFKANISPQLIAQKNAVQAVTPQQ